MCIGERREMRGEEKREEERRGDLHDE